MQMTKKILNLSGLSAAKIFIIEMFLHLSLVYDKTLSTFIIVAPVGIKELSCFVMEDFPRNLFHYLLFNIV